jgi:hypothetical protein
VTNSTRASTEAERKRIGDAGGTVTRSHLRQGRTTDEFIRLGDELEVGLLVQRLRLGRPSRALSRPCGRGRSARSRHCQLGL